jgi:hypothetical protein
MTRVFEVDAGRMKFVNPTTGYVALDTDKPMPADIGEVEFNNVELFFPVVPGETTHNEYVGSTGKFRFWTTYPASDSAASQVLGAFTGGVAPKMIYGLARFRQTRVGGNATGAIETCMPLNEWVQWPSGSLLLQVFGQNGPIHMWRHLDIGVSGGNWVLTQRQGNSAIKTSKTYTPLWGGTSSRFEIDLKLRWGVYK